MATMSTRAVKRLRTHLGATIRTMRTDAELSQVALAQRAGLSGKFLGEVERGEKSISMDSLWRLGMALRRRRIAFAWDALFPGGEVTR